MKHQYFRTEQLNIRVEQGYEIGRPSLLHLNGEVRDGKIAVSVGGKVIPIAKGQLL
jgi:trans-2,3-dihydro-3-hydroxyanthranilate isomerase